MAPLSSLHLRPHITSTDALYCHLTRLKKPCCQNVVFCKTNQEDQDLSLTIGDQSLKFQRRDLLLHSVLGSLSLAAIVPLAFAEEVVPEGYRIYTDDVNKFKITIPQDWLVGGGEGNGFKSVTAFYPSEASTSNVSLVITGLGADYTKLESFGKVDSFAETLVSGLDRSWQRPPGVSAKLIDSKSSKVEIEVQFLFFASQKYPRVAAGRGSMRDLVIQLQEAVNQLNQSMQSMNGKIATIETGQAYKIQEWPKSLFDTYQSARMQEFVKAANTKRPPTTQLALPCTPFNKTTNTMNTPPKKQLSQKEYEEKRSKNLCFYCDQKYVPRHKCSEQLFSLEVLAEEESTHVEEEVETPTAEESVEEQVVYPHISLNALAGINTFHIMRIKVHVGKQDVHILVDSGSTHNFVDVQCAKKLECEIRSICPLQVEVPGGNQMLSTSTLVVYIGGHQMELSYLKNGILFFGKKGLASEEEHTLFELLASFEDVFAIPNTLPPHRNHDHRIVLQEGVPPVKIRPYKHPPTQKDAIELMVKELLETGVIRPSHSPFSSPIVMVKKMEPGGCAWIIESSTVFTKLDLRYGYHQIRMADEDVHKTAFRTHEGHYEFLAMPFGLTNSPSTFRSLMNSVFNHLRHFVLLAFERLKEAIIQTPVLALPNFEVEFVVETDASRIGLGAVLQQRGHPIAYLSKTLAPKHQSLSTYEKEFMAVVLALEKWRGYLLDRHFKIKTDHFSLKYLLDQRLSTPFQTKWRKLLGFDYEISYKKGPDNAAADALSRLSTSAELHSMILSSIEPELLDKIKASWIANVDVQLLIQRLEDQIVPNKKFT
uniref:RNA-directed DNA polymerase n=1 Tax=Tanacetum cinerariifolium TaxID=118510 RepID=A0A6L2MAE9_TANCI|nr:PsbP domain-containing protein 3, chloroplastic isoform X1 [Tanacetum cinerariifolium]